MAYDPTTKDRLNQLLLDLADVQRQLRENPTGTIVAPWTLRNQQYVSFLAPESVPSSAIPRADAAIMEVHRGIEALVVTTQQGFDRVATAADGATRAVTDSSRRARVESMDDFKQAVLLGLTGGFGGNIAAGGLDHLLQNGWSAEVRARGWTLSTGGVPAFQIVLGLAVLFAAWRLAISYVRQNKIQTQSPR